MRKEIHTPTVNIEEKNSDRWITKSTPVSHIYWTERKDQIVFKISIYLNSLVLNVLNVLLLKVREIL